MKLLYAARSPFQAFRDWAKKMSLTLDGAGPIPECLALKYSIALSVRTAYHLEEMRQALCPAGRFETRSAMTESEQPLNAQEIMRAYNRYERMGMEIPGMEKVATPSLVKFVAPGKHGSFIAYFDLDEQSVDAAIEMEIATFSALDKAFEWKVYDTDAPAAIGTRLLDHGFAPGEAEAFMALDLASVTVPFAENDRCVEVADAGGIRDAIAVQEIVWGRDFSSQRTHLLDLKAAAPDSVTIYVVYDDDTPVSAAWIVYTHNSPFAGIWGGATVEGHRGKGYYSALLHKRINDAKRRGVRYLIIDASPMSRPIVEKHGFTFVAHTTPYVYEKE